jgi:hypothetical protein
MPKRPPNLSAPFGRADSGIPKLDPGAGFRFNRSKAADRISEKVAKEKAADIRRAAPLTKDEAEALDAVFSAGRGNATQRGYDHRWRAARKVYLSHNVYCVACKQAGIVTAAAVVDHIIPHKGDMLLFWDKKNWQGLCRKCHNRKTFAEDVTRKKP